MDMESTELSTKELIVNKAIDMLKVDGLKFSVDELSSQLKISKKTVYKHFSTKEELATIIYKKLFDDIHLAADTLLIAIPHDKSQLVAMLELLQTALLFNDENLFNRYALNDIIKQFAQSSLEKMWQKTEKLFILCNLTRVVAHFSFKQATISSLKVLTGKGQVSDLLSLLIGE